MRYIPKRPEIEEAGLQSWLDTNYAEFGGYEEFVKRVNLGEPKTVMGRAFSVGKDTIYEWLRIYEKEQGNDGSAENTGTEKA